MNKRTQIIIAIVLIIVLVILFASKMKPIPKAEDQTAATSTPTTAEQAPEQPAGKVAAASVPDGDYAVTIKEVHVNAEDANFLLKPMKLSGSTYVYATGTPDITAPISRAVTVILNGKLNAEFIDLEPITTDPSYTPVFEMTIEHGMVVTIVEKTKKQ